MKIENIALGVVTAVSLLLIAGQCHKGKKHQQRLDNIDARIETYMENRPQYELDSINRVYFNGERKQAALDSLAYRDIFMGTNAVKDSILLNEFNKVTSLMNSPKVDSYRWYYLNENLSEMLTHSQYKKIQKETNNDLLTLQFKADSVAYRRFFEKHGLLTDSLARKLTMVAKKIKP